MKQQPPCISMEKYRIVRQRHLGPSPPVPHIAPPLSLWKTHVGASSTRTDVICRPATRSQQSHTLLHRAHAKKKIYRKSILLSTASIYKFLGASRTPWSAKSCPDTPPSKCVWSMYSQKFVSNNCTAAYKDMDVAFVQTTEVPFKQLSWVPMSGREVKFRGRKELWCVGLCD